MNRKRSITEEEPSRCAARSGGNQWRITACAGRRRAARDAGTNLARVADPKKLKAEIKIAETQAKDVLPGQKATIDTRNGIVTGHVFANRSVSQSTVTVSRLA